MATVLSTSLGRTLFAWRFILIGSIDFSVIKWFLFLCFVSRYLQNQFNGQKWSDLGNFYSKLVVWEMFVKTYIYFSSLILNYQCTITILWKSQKFWTGGTCCKPASKLPTCPINFCIFCSHFYQWKKWKYSVFFCFCFLRNQWQLTRVNFFLHR